MKHTVKSLLLACAFALSGIVAAQDPGPGTAPKAPAQEGKKRLTRKEQEKLQAEIFAKLSLTEEQKAKFKKHDEEYAAKLKELGGKRKNRTEAEKEKLKELRKEHAEFLKQTLTKEQLREFQKLRREHLSKKDDK